MRASGARYWLGVVLVAAAGAQTETVSTVAEESLPSRTAPDQKNKLSLRASISWDLIFHSVALPPPASPSAARTAQYGFYPIRLYDLSPEKSLFSADFYFWVRFPEGAYGEEDAPAFEAANGERLDCEVVEYNPVPDGTRTFWYRCRSRFYHRFELTLYPFDHQTLEIRIESPSYPLTELQFDPITASHVRSARDNMLEGAIPDVSSCVVSWVKTYADKHKYSTDWGFPSRQDLTEYSQAVLEIRLRHYWTLPMLALLGPNLLAALLAALVVGSKQEGTGRMQALLGIIAATAAQNYALMVNAPGASILRFAQVYFVIMYAVLTLCVWYAMTRDKPLPTRYVWRWVGGHMALTLLALGIHFFLGAMMQTPVPH